MPYRLQDGESVREGVRRCSREQLDRAVGELSEGIKVDPVEAIHDARKALKKQRSLLRLARAAFPAEERRQESAVFRNAARKLSGTRDADVMIEALDDLAERSAGTVPRHAFKLARAEPTPENLHDWRKRVKDLWYHLRLLKPLSGPTMGGQADEAHRLSELLGDDHDLWVLREALSAMEDDVPAGLDPLLGAVDHRRTELERAAILLGQRLYAEKPGAFVRRIHHYWKAWRAETTAGASVAAPG